MILYVTILLLLEKQFWEKKWGKWAQPERLGEKYLWPEIPIKNVYQIIVMYL